jgi:AcrR family transcriptional regulator
MDDIAQAMKISKRTLYELFGDKEKLLIEGIKIFQETESRAYEELQQKSGNILESYLNWNSIHTEIIQGVNENFYHDIKYYDQIKDTFLRDKNKRDEFKKIFFKKGVEQGLFRDDLNYELLLHISSKIESSIYQLELAKTYTLKDIINSVLIVHIRGFCTQKGNETLDKYLSEHPNF